MPVAVGPAGLLPLQALPEWLWTYPTARGPLGKPITLTYQLLNFAEQAVDTDAGTQVVASVTDGAGVLIATIVGWAGFTGRTTGQYQVTLPALANPDTLSVTWTSTVNGQVQTDLQPVEVLAQRLVSLSAITGDAVLAKLSAAQQEYARTAVETVFSWALGYPCVAAGKRLSFYSSRATLSSPLPFSVGRGLLWGGDAPRMLLPEVLRPIRIFSGVVNQQPLQDVDLIRCDRGMAWYIDGRPWLPGYYQLHLAHGMRTIPEDLRSAAVIFARDLAQTQKLPERAMSVTSEQSTILFSLPTADRPTGLPRVDAVLNRYRNQAVV